MADLEILGIPGSLRKTPFNRSALTAAQSLLPAGASLDIFDLASRSTTRTSTSSRPPGWWS